MCRMAFLTRPSSNCLNRPVPARTTLIIVKFDPKAMNCFIGKIHATLKSFVNYPNCHPFWRLCEQPIRGYSLTPALLRIQLTRGDSE
jgi:hypothetical protein